MSSTRVVFRVCAEGKWLKSPVLHSWTADINEAMHADIEVSKIDYSYIKTMFLDLVEEEFIKDSFVKDTLEIHMFDEAGLTTYATFKFINTATQMNVESITPAVPKYPADVNDTIDYMTEVMFKEAPDMHIRILAKTTMSSAISSMKSLLGIDDSLSTESSEEGEDAIEALCKKISSETKAEVVKPKETLEDYICNNILKEELEEIVDFFKNADVYKNANVELPKGILLKGVWGTGKTYAARCIAGTVSSYFMTCTASALQGMYIGSGAENIRKVFKGAKLLAEKSKKGVIVFIDEIDSFGDRQNRGGGASGEEDRTLNQLLAEMSGFESNSNVMVLAATNFPERLDSALMRSGRFGRQITIDYPDDYERLDLVKYYCSKLNFKLNDLVTHAEITDLTKGLTPADIKEIINEACILAIRHKHTEISLDEINEAINKVITKNIRQPDAEPNDFKLITAHECGHVLAEYLYNKTCPIKVTNYSYGSTGGFTQSAEVLSGIVSKDRLINEIKILLGGRAAEEVYCGYITNGASNDLEKVKKLLYSYYEHYNFEHFEIEKLDQLVLDKIQEIYNQIVNDFKETSNYDNLTKLITSLSTSRVLYTSDIKMILKDISFTAA